MFEFGAFVAGGHQRHVQAVVLQVVEQLAPGAGYQFEADVGIASMVFRQQRWQAAAGAGLYRADPQGAPRDSVGVHRAFGFVHQGQDAFAVIKEDFTGGADRQPASGTDEQRRAQFAFQLFDARGDVRRHAMQLRRGLSHAAGLRHGSHHLQLGHFHCSVPLISEVRNA